MGPCILLQVYHDLHYMVTIGKFNVIVAHVSLLQVWVYEHIIMFIPMGLVREMKHIQPCTIGYLFLFISRHHMISRYEE